MPHSQSPPPIPPPLLELNEIEVTMIANRNHWNRISNNNLPWDPSDLVGRIFDATVNAVADAVVDAEENQTSAAA